MSGHSDGRAVERTCRLVVLSDIRLWRSCATCTSRPPKEFSSVQERRTPKSSSWVFYLDFSSVVLRIAKAEISMLLLNDFMTNFTFCILTNGWFCRQSFLSSASRDKVVDDIAQILFYWFVILFHPGFRLNCKLWWNHFWRQQSNIKFLKNNNNI